MSVFVAGSVGTIAYRHGLFRRLGSAVMVPKVAGPQTAAVSTSSATSTSSSSSASSTPEQKNHRDRWNKPKQGNKPTLHKVVDGPNEIEVDLAPAIEEAHAAACRNGEAMYTDPTTGLMVFTKFSHIQRGNCCGNRCRHCAYDHVNVPAYLRVKKTKSPPSTPTKQKNESAVSSSATGNSSVEANDTNTNTQAARVTHKASVYTKTGDGGTSSLFTGERRSKTDPVFEALGTVDELNSFIGLAREMCLRQQEKEQQQQEEEEDTAASSSLQPAPADVLTKAQVWSTLIEQLDAIQHNLLDVGSIVATPNPTAEVLQSYDPPTWTKELEDVIDAFDKTQPQLMSFILPGGGMAAAQLHVCRSVCRRAERCLILAKEETAASPMTKDGTEARRYGRHMMSAMRYVNRLSDFFFVAARAVAEDASERTRRR